MKEIECPYCYSSHITTLEDSGRYLCRECECMFDEQDIQLESLRHRISRVLSANFATENNPFPCEMELGEWCDNSDGELTFLYPHLISIFETYDGIICFNLEEYDNPIEFDGMPILDLEEIADAID